MLQVALPCLPEQVAVKIDRTYDLEYIGYDSDACRITPEALTAQGTMESI